MALFKFVENIIKGKPIELYNSGNHSRDFSYIDNVVDFISSCSNKIKRKKSIHNRLFKRDRLKYRFEVYE